MSATANWIGVSGDWSTATNWNDDTVPDASANVVISNATTVPDTITGAQPEVAGALALSGPVTLSGQSFTAGTVSVAVSGGAEPALSLGAGATLNALQSLTLAGDDLVALDGGTLDAAAVDATDSTFDLAGGAATVGQWRIDGGTGGDVFDVSGGVLTIADDLLRAGAADVIQVQGGVGQGAFVVDGTVDLGGLDAAAENGGAVRFANVASAAAGAGADSFSVDAYSSMEIGSAGDALAGAFTVDAGQTLVDGGTVSAPTIVDNGVIEVGADESLALDASGAGLVGSGRVEIEAGAALTLAAVGASSAVGVVFAGDDARLNLSATSLAANLAFAPAITGFDVSDRIEFSGDVTDDRFAAGVLTLYDRGAVVATLNLAGERSDDVFDVCDVDGVSQIALSSGGDTSTAPAGTATPDAYVWTAEVAGSWDNAANWSDAAAGRGPAALAPGADDSVTVAGAPGVWTIVTGTGDAASLALAGDADLTGQLAAGVVQMEAGASALLAAGAALQDRGDLDLGPDDSLSVSGGALSVVGMAVESGPNAAITLDGGSIVLGGDRREGGRSDAIDFAVSAGELLIAGDEASDSDVVTVTGAGRFIVDGVTTLGRLTFRAEDAGAIQLKSVAADGLAQDYFDVAGQGSIEIGSTGAAAAGSFTLDAGERLSEGGAITAPILNLEAGSVLAVNDDETLNLNPAANSANAFAGELTGAGTLEIGRNANLVMGVATDPAATSSIDFMADDGALYLDAACFTGGVFSPKLQNFGASDSLVYDGAVDSVAFASGVLTLSDKGVVLGRLALAGNYSGDTFYSAPSDYGAEIAFSAGGDTQSAPVGTRTADSYVWGSDVAGSWDAAANWTDPSQGQASAAAAPGADDLVSIGGSPNTPDIVTGTGVAKSLTLGCAQIDGRFTAASATLAAGSSAFIGPQGGLNVANNFVFAAGSQQLTIDGGKLDVGGQWVDATQAVMDLSSGDVTVGGITLGVGYFLDNMTRISGGLFTVTGSVGGGGGGNRGGSFDVSGSGRFVVDGVEQLGAQQFAASDDGVIQLASTAGSAGGADIFDVSGQGVIEIGSAGGAAAGAFTLDAGKTIVDGGQIAAPTIALGAGSIFEIGAGESLVMDGALAGSGEIEIGDGATLSLAGLQAGARNTIDFGAADGALTLAAGGADGGAFGPTIAGFAAGDVIQLAGVDATGLSIAGDVLTVLDDDDVVMRLTLAGYASGSTFGLSEAGGQATISLTAGGDAAPAIVATPGVSVARGLAAALAGVVVYEATAAPAMTVTLSAAHGVLLADGASGISGSGSQALTLSGSLATVDAELATLRYVAQSGADDTIEIAASNGLGGATRSAIEVEISPPPPTLAITSAGGLTNRAQQTISGTIDANDVGLTISLYDGATLLGTTLASPTGAWSCVATLLPTQGAQTLTAKAANPAGFSGTSSPVVYTLDTSPPVLTISSPGGATNQASQTLSGTIDAADAGLTISIFDGTTLLGATKANAAGAWRFAAILPAIAGAQSISAQAVDAAGNVGTSAAVVYTLDTIAPALTISSAGGMTGATSQTISGTIDPADAGLAISLYDGATLLGTTTADATGAWTYAATLPSIRGAQPITARATDAAGNVGVSAAVDYTLDSLPPALAIVGAGPVSGQRKQTISGTIDVPDAGLTITLYDGAVSLGATKANASGLWTCTATLPSILGPQPIRAQATGAGGNVGAASVELLDPAQGAVCYIGAAAAAAWEAAGTPALAPKGDAVKLRDTAANLQGLSAAQLGGLAAMRVGGVLSANAGVKWTLAQALALAAEKLVAAAPAGYAVGVADSGAAVAALTAAQISALAAAGYTSIFATSAPTLTPATALALAGASLVVHGAAAAVQATPAAIAALTAAQAAAMARAGGKTLQASGDVTLGLAAAETLAADGFTIAGAGVSVLDLAGAVGRLTGAAIGQLKTLGVGRIAASDAGFSIGAGAAAALLADAVDLGAPSGDLVTLAATAAYLEGLTPAQIGALAASGVAELFAADANVSYSVAQTSAILAKGLTLAAKGSLTVTEASASGVSTTYENGQEIGLTTVHADRSYSVEHLDVVGQAYSAFEAIYNKAGARVAIAYDDVDGVGALTLQASGLSFAISSSAPTLTVGSDGFSLDPHVNQTISATGFGHETFIAAPAAATPWADILSGFIGSGSGADLLEFEASAFGAGVTTANALAALLAGATSSASGSATIHDAAGDTLTLAGVSLSQLKALPASVFKFI